MLGNVHVLYTCLEPKPSTYRAGYVGPSYVWTPYTAPLYIDGPYIGTVYIGALYVELQERESLYRGSIYRGSIKRDSVDKGAINPRGTSLWPSTQDTHGTHCVIPPNNAVRTYAEPMRS